MISIRFDEYAVKRHLFIVFVGLLLFAIAFLYVQGERIFLSVLSSGETQEQKNIYRNAEFGFSAAYPERYLVAEEAGQDFLRVYFTAHDNPPFFLQSSPVIFIARGNWRDYVLRTRQYPGKRIISERSITVGSSIFAKEIVSSVEGEKRLKETVFGRTGFTYIIGQQYDEALDPAYPLLVKTFQFE